MLKVHRGAGVWLLPIFFLFSACGLFDQPSTTGSIVTMLAPMPALITQVRATVRGVGISPPIVATFNATATSGIINQIPPGTNHTLTLEALNASGAVIFEGTVTGLSVTAGATTDAGVVTMTQIAGATPPSSVTGFAATAGDGTVTLTWNAASGTAGVRVMRRSDGTNPEHPLDGVLVYEGAATSASDTGLANGTAYHYTAFAYSSDPFFSTGVSVTATPAAAGTVQWGSMQWGTGQWKATTP